LIFFGGSFGKKNNLKICVFIDATEKYMSVQGRSQRPLYSAKATFHHLHYQKSLPPTTTTFETTSLASLLGIVLGVVLVVLGILTEQWWITYMGFGEMIMIIIGFIYFFTVRN